MEIPILSVDLCYHAPQTAPYIRRLLMTVIRAADEASRFALDIFRSSFVRY